MLRKIGLLCIALLVGLTTLIGGAGQVAAASHPAGAVYALSNAAAGNAVLIYDRADDGTLTPAGSVATGGLGLGAGLGSQGAVVLGKKNKFLFAVNAGSNDISVFAVRRNGLELVDRVPSGGVQPISLTTHDDTLYVLNAGGTGNITGFRIRDGGKLAALPDTTRPLSSTAAGPAQVQFNPDGDLLAVTEKATNTIDIYRIDDGAISGPMSVPSAGRTPFGFVFDRNNKLIISEAFGGAAGAGAVSSYDVSDEGVAQVVSPSVANHQGAPCWVALSNNGRYAYVANTGSGTVSAYRVNKGGSLELLADGVSGTTGDNSRPADLALSGNGRFLYVRNGGNGTISIFRATSNGELSNIGTASGLPANSAGIAVR